MTDQLALSLDAATDRVYLCCGAPAPPPFTDPPHFDHPHAEDCPNPNVGTYIDRYGRIIARLWCSDDARLGGPCPYGGHHPPPGPNVVDPYNNACCKEVARA